MPAPCLNDIASAVQLTADRIESAADGPRGGTEPAGVARRATPGPADTPPANARPIELRRRRLVPGAGSNHPAAPSGLRRDEPSRGSRFQDSGYTGIEWCPGADPI